MKRATRQNLLIVAAAAGLWGAAAAQGQTWTATSDGDWNVAANWNNGAGPAPTSGNTTQLTFDAVGSVFYTATNNITPFSVNRITFNNTGSETITLAGNPLTLGGTTPTLTGTGLAVINNNIAGTTLTKTGTGTVTLLGANTYTNTTVSAGILQVGNGGTTGTLGTGTLNVATGATFIFNRSDAITDARVISGAGTFRKAGAGMLTLTGNNTFTGTLQIDGGTVRIQDVSTDNNGSGDFDAANIVVNNGGRFEFFGPAGNPDLPAGTTITVNTGGVVEITEGEDYGRVVVDGGTFSLNAGGNLNNNLGSTTASELRSGTINASGTGSFGGANPFRKTTAGTVTLDKVSLNGTGGLSIEEGVLSTNAAIGATGTLSFGTNGAGATAGTLRYTGPTGTLNKPGLINDGGGTIEVADATALTYAGVADGTGALTKAGNGTLVLTNSNTYAGGTTIAAGTLQLGDGGALGSIAGNVTNNGTLTFHRSNAVNFAGNISGSGGITKLNSNTVILNGAMSYTGATTVTAGALRIAPAAAGPVTIGPVSVSPGATFGMAFPGGGTTTLTVPSLAISDGGSPSLQLSLDTATIPASPLVSVTTADGLTVAGVPSIAVSNAKPFSIGTYTLIDYSGTPLADGAFSLAPLPARTQGALVFNSAQTSVQLSVTGVDSIRWNGDLSTTWDTGSDINAGGTNNWRLVSNSSVTNFVSNDVVAFTEAAAGSGTVDIPSDVLPASITVDNTAKAYTFQGAGAITGAASLTKQGSGTLTILTNNTYTGGTTVSAGTLHIGNGTVAAAIGSGNLVNNANVIWDVPDVFFGGGISGTGNITKLGARNFAVDGQVTLSGSIALGTSTLTLNAPGSYILPAAISGTGGLVKNGPGTLTLTGANTFTGDTTLTTGGISIGDGGTTGSLAGNVNMTGGTTLTFDRSNDFTYAGNITNGSTGGVIAKTGAGTATLSGVITQPPTNPGSINLQQGRLNLTGNNSLNGGIAVAPGATLGVDTTGFTQTYIAPLSGQGTIIKTGDGTLRLLGNNNPFTGTLQIDAGTVVLADEASGGDLGASLIVVNNGGTFQFGGAPGSGENPDHPESTYIQINTGGNVTWNIGEVIGGVHLQGGTLTFVGGGITSSGTSNQNWTGGTVTTSDATARNIGGAAPIIKTTPGVVTVSGAATIGTAINIQDGTIAFATAANLGSNALQFGATGAGATTGTFEYQGVTPASARAGAFTFNGDGIVRVTEATTVLTLSGVMGGAGTMNKEGPGTLVLTGNGTINGGVNVSAGTLAVNGQTAPNSGSGTAPVSVAAGATLAGTGSIAGTTSLLGTGSTLSPGGVAADATSSLVGKLTVGGTVLLAAGSVLSVQVGDPNGSVAPVGGVDYDQLAMTSSAVGALAISSGARLNVIPLAGIVEGQVFTIVDQTGGGTLTGAFQDMTGTPLPEGTRFNAGGQLFQINYTGGDVTLTAVPEPTAAATVLLAGAGLLLGRRRRTQPNA